MNIRLKAPKNIRLKAPKITLRHSSLKADVTLLSVRVYHLKECEPLPDSPYTDSSVHTVIIHRESGTMIARRREEEPKFRDYINNAFQHKNVETRIWDITLTGESNTSRSASFYQKDLIIPTHKGDM
jgi:hypothetical protein